MESTVLALLFLSASNVAHLPPGLLKSLCQVESSNKINAVHRDDGKGSSLGVCQIQLATARELGFKGTEKDLMKPKNNIKYAALYLSHQIKRYGGNIKRGVCAYNKGRSDGDGNNKYTRKVYKVWREQQ